jgi:branched-chain amino acid transport system permease protein
VGFWEVLLQQLVTGLSNGLIIALVALGYTMVYGIAGLINFAHGEVVMLGCFLTLTLIGACGMAPGAGGAVPWLGIAGLLLAVPLCTGALAWSVDRLAYRPLRLRGTSRLGLLVSAIGVSFILLNLGLLWGALPMGVFAGGRIPTARQDVPDLIGYRNLLGDGAVLQLTAKDLLVAATTLPLLAGLTWFVRRTRLGTAMRACAQDPQAAALMGIDVQRVVGAAFLIGGALAGVAAVVRALYDNTIDFQMGYRTGLDAFTAAVLGGIGNLPGAVVGALVIGLVRAFSDQYLASVWSNTAVFAVLILALVFRPAGLLGARVRERA